MKQARTLLIINKSGGLIYRKDLIAQEDIHNSSGNEYLIFASTLHSIFAIATQLTPTSIKLGESGNSGVHGEDIIENVPYINNENSNVTNNNNSGKNANKKRLGTYKGEDYFDSGFKSWNKSGIRQIETDTLEIYVYQTLTGVKFVLIFDKNNKNDEMEGGNMITSMHTMDNALRRVYCAWSDCVMKDPFYTMEMPVKNELFDERVVALLRRPL